MKQAKKLFKNAGERFNIRVERPKSKAGHKEPQFSEETLSLKDFEGFEKDDKCEHGDDFVNISLKQCDTEVKQVREIKENQPANDRSPQKRLMSVVNTGKALLQRKTKSQTEAAQAASQNMIKHSVSNPIPMRKNSSYRDIDDKSQSASSSPKHLPDKSRQRAHSDTSLIRLPEDKTENGFHSDVESLSDEEDVCDMKRTREVISCQNPVWNQKFTFDVDEDHKYLNVCVWCRSPEKLDKHERVVKPGKEILMGHKTLSLTDVALECLMTLQCDTQQTISLVPPEQRAGASRSKISNFAGCQGKEERLCNGEVTLAFTHNPTKFSDKERKYLTRKDHRELNKDNHVRTKMAEKDTNIKVENLDQDPSIPDIQIKRLEIGRHDFTLANFTSATYCHFCGRKIWLKAAVQCDTCSMICHKKCTEECQLKTLCTQQGAKVRTMPSEPWKPPINQSEDRKKTAKSKAGIILSKFRKDSTGAGVDRKPEKSASTHSTPEHIPVLKIFPIPSPKSSPQHSPIPSPQRSPQLSPHTSPLPSRRRNSAPGPADRPVDQEDRDYYYDSSDESENEMKNIIRKTKKRATGQNLDEVVVTAAKEMGKELYAELSLEERKEKLDSMVTKLQKEIDTESENKTEIMKAEQDTTDPHQKETLRTLIAKSDEKVEALMMMMLHYCAGLQYCLDQEEEERKKLSGNMDSEEKLDLVLIADNKGSVTLETPDLVFTADDKESIALETPGLTDDKTELYGNGVPSAGQNGSSRNVIDDVCVESSNDLRDFIESGDGFKELELIGSEGITFKFESSDSEVGLSDNDGVSDTTSVKQGDVVTTDRGT